MNSSNVNLTGLSDNRRLSVAPMIDVTDRHCRFFHRLLAPNALLYTEMISTGAILHGNVNKHLDFNVQEHPVALQLGGSDPIELSKAASIGQKWGYSEINLNCGCPSQRVQKGSFGACLMADPALVADCCKAMQDTVDVPVTIKHRLGLDYDENYGLVRDFVGVLFDAGINVFIVHARNAVLKGLSPKQNRDIPPLRYDVAERLKNDFPTAVFVLNGGISQIDQAVSFSSQFDGVMLGRAAWHTPEILRSLHSIMWPNVPLKSKGQILNEMILYAENQLKNGVPLRFIARAMLGWPTGMKGARQWRRSLSDADLLNTNNVSILEKAWRDLQVCNRQKA